jgi:hypothetical protein
MTAAAADDGYVDEALDALATTNVFVSGEVDGSAELTTTLQAQIGDSSIGVAVFSDNASLEAGNSEILRALAGGTDYDTIVIAVGNDLSAGSSVLNSGEALQIANEAESSAGSPADALTQTIAEVQARTPDAAPAVDGGLIVGLALGGAALVAAVITTIAVVRRRRPKVEPRGTVPDGIRPLLTTLRSLETPYLQVAATGNRVAADTARDIAAVTDNVGELFARIDRRSDGSQHTLAAVEYEDKLRKLTAALDREYLLDILTHPQLWDDPDDRVAEVRNALTAVSNELVENIKQVNARRALHFQVSLDGMIGRRKELQEWDRAFDSASDPGSAPDAPRDRTAPGD